ncbi:MAG TPA: hypothetical protein VLA71_04615 [Algoriphagus sp.]|nr:hypothetical protein [Algoriphagus sp.]
MKKVAFFIFFVALSVPKILSGQEQELSPNLLTMYQEQLPLFQELVTGGQYADPPINYLGSPFFDSRFFQNGRIQINGISYSKVPLLYDTWLDDVITFHPIYNQKILIKAEKVDEFTLADNSIFRKFIGNSDYGKHNHGFYQVISDGEIKLLKKNYSNVESVKESGLITREYRSEKDYFFWFDGKFQKVNKKKEGIAALGLSKKAVAELNSKVVFQKSDPQAYLLELLDLKKNDPAPFTGFPQQ